MTPHDLQTIAADHGVTAHVMTWRDFAAQVDAEAQDVIEWLASDTSDLPLEQQIALAYGDCNLEARRNEILEHYKEATPEEQEALREELAESEQVE